ncbi:MAG TPA: cytochrome P450, partial [Chitinophagaceae bacterium]
VSMGDVTAVYAAGGLSLEDTIKVMIDCAMVHKVEGNNFLSLYLQSSLISAHELSKEAPAFVAPIYEAGDHSVLALCNQDDKTPLGYYFDSKGISWDVPHSQNSWPYHTKLIKQHREEISNYSTGVQPLPLHTDFYSSVWGRCIPARSIIPNNYWFSLSHNPVLVHSALQAASREPGMEVMVNIGPQTIAKGQVIRSTGNRNIEVLESISRTEDEIKLQQEVQNNLSAYRFHKPPEPPADIVSDFIHHFSLLHPQVQQDPDTHLQFLKLFGNTHFLPMENKWIMLDYDEIDHALKNPQIFSSSLHKTFDETLLGTDAPDQESVRSMLSPLFSQQVFSDLAGFTTAYADDLLDKLAAKKQFEVVDEFSLPLAKAVTTRMLCLSDDEAAALDRSINSHVYSMTYLNELYDFFKGYMEKQQAGNSNAGGLLLSLVQEGKITMEGAAKLLRLLWVAGMTTTSMLISMTVYQLFKDDAITERLRQQEELINKFIEECLRLEAPESELTRITTKDVQSGNITIPEGSTVLLMLRSANRDPKYFEEPEIISFDRPFNTHLSFGAGYHYCLGAGLARLEATHALKSVLQKLQGWQLREASQVDWYPSPHFRALATLNIYTA